MGLGGRRVGDVNNNSGEDESRSGELVGQADGLY